MGQEEGKLIPFPGRPHEEARWARFRLALILFLVAASVISWLVLGKDGQQEASEGIEMRVLSIKETFPLALNAARGWRTDAVLNWADMTFQPVTLNSRLDGAFAFRSPSEPHLWFLVTVRESGKGLEVRSQGGVYEVPEPEPIGESIDPLQLPLDSAEALEIIMRNGGQEFVARHPGIVWPLTVSLRYSDFFHSRGDLRWVGLLLDLSTLEDQDIAIDALTGRLVD
ncbi:MAG: hypothetical protein AB1449_15185 [Chloroflexota bacterium]